MVSNFYGVIDMHVLSVNSWTKSSSLMQINPGVFMAFVVCHSISAIWPVVVMDFVRHA